MSKTTFQQENDKVLEFILDRKFFEDWSIDTLGVYNLNDTVLELYVTGDCNQKCEYCYIVKHGDKLYPDSIRDHDLIISNLHSLLNWIVNNKLKPPRIDLFSGEIWGLSLGNRIFDTLLEFLDNHTIHIPFVMIPSNMSFTLNEKYVTLIDDYITEFSKRGTRLSFSASVDGLELEEKNRPFKDKVKNKLRDQDFYDNLFIWMKKHEFGFHPMVSACSIEQWISNFDWWMSMFNKYDFSFGRNLMLLEVRNDDWTDTKIDKYLEFIEYVFYYAKDHIYKNNIDVMSADLIRLFVDKKGIIKDYSNIGLSLMNDVPACTIHRNLVIRLGDLSIVPCHRLSYDKFHYGKFITDNNEITGIASHNIQFATRTYTSNNSIASLGCDSCGFNEFCIKGCWGSQFESTGDPFIPIESVCRLFKRKIIFLFNLYKKEGLFRPLEELNYHRYNQYIDKNKMQRMNDIIKSSMGGLINE